MVYEVKLPAFEGPFDLLLHLIAKREVDIYEVSLAEITAEYLAHLKTLRELDLEVATEFLIVAATLIEMKASRLLPGPPADHEEALALSERDLLIARLLEYRAFKAASAELSALMTASDTFVPRRVGPGEEFGNVCPDLLARVSPERLAALATAALSPKERPRVDISHITPIRVTVEEAVEQVEAALARRPRVSFRELTALCTSRIEVVVRFLAVLELVKRGDVDVAQSGTFGDIVVERVDASVTGTAQPAPAEAEA